MQPYFKYTLSNNYLRNDYPFGMLMPDRNGAVSGTDYRYGFNGQEQETEISNSNSHTSAEYWMYDSRLGRRWNLDPEPVPSMSYYHSFEGNPIIFSDPLGNKVEYSGATKKERREVKRDIRREKANNAQFRANFRILKNDAFVTYRFQKVNANQLAVPASVSAAVNTNIVNYAQAGVVPANRNPNNNPLILPGGNQPNPNVQSDGNVYNDANEVITINYRTPNSENISSGVTSNTGLAERKPVNLYSKKSYLSGTITIDLAATNQEGPAGNVLTIYQGGNQSIIATYNLPPGNLNLRGLNINFNFQSPTQIRFEIRNPTTKGNDPGAIGVYGSINSN